MLLPICKIVDFAGKSTYGHLVNDYNIINIFTIY